MNHLEASREELIAAAARSIAAVSYREEIRAMMKAGTLDEDQISHLVNLNQQTFNIVERELKLTGFWESIPARNKLKAELQSTLLQPEFKELPGMVQNRLCLISRIMEIAEKNNDTILYAE